MARFTQDYMKSKLSYISPQIKVLDISHDLKRLDCQCLKCGYEWNASWDKLSRGRGCHKCAGTLKLTIRDLIDRVSMISPSITITSKEYTNNRSKIACECKVCNHQWETTAKNLLNGSGCVKCKNIAGANKRRLTQEKIQSNLPKNIQVLKVEDNLVEWECSVCHTTHKTKYSILQQGQKRCEICRGYKTRPSYTQAEAESLISQVNKKVKIIGKYTGSQSRIQSQCVKCGYKWNPKFNDLQQGSGCPKCVNQVSQVEADFLSHFTGWEKNRQILKGKELDAYFPSQRVAIEINGAYWHTDNQGKDRGYHLSKTKECEEQNVKLYHFFDSEILDKQDICVSMINKSIGKSKRIFARQCEIREISPKQAKTFCIENHIQGYCVDKVRYGLFYKDELMSVMTFGKSRYNKQYEWELLRFCSKVGYIIVGGASKLLKHFERNISPKSLISYGNRRWCHKEKNVYDTIGFKYKGETLPNYFYERAGLMYSRQTFQRHKLNELFGYDFNEVLTESEIMSFYGFYRVYDCGNLVYTKEYINGC